MNYWRASVICPISALTHPMLDVQCKCGDIRSKANTSDVRRLCNECGPVGPCYRRHNSKNHQQNVRVAVALDFCPIAFRNPLWHWVTVAVLGCWGAVAGCWAGVLSSSGNLSGVADGPENSDLANMRVLLCSTYFPPHPSALVTAVTYYTVDPPLLKWKTTVPKVRLF